jgi:hypothetical protein
VVVVVVVEVTVAGCERVGKYGHLVPRKLQRYPGSIESTDKEFQRGSTIDPEGEPSTIEKFC